MVEFLHTLFLARPQSFITSTFEQEKTFAILLSLTKGRFSSAPMCLRYQGP